MDELIDALRRGRGLWLTYLGLLAVGVPWWWPAGSTATVAGVPAWVAVSIGASAVASVVTAAAFLRPWPGEEGVDDGPAADAGGGDAGGGDGATSAGGGAGR